VTRQSTGAEVTSNAGTARPEAQVGATHPSKLRLLRFGVVERLVHWTTAGLVGTLIATGGVLYVPAFGDDLGGRSTAEMIHNLVGLFVLVPVVVGLVLPWGRELRADLSRFNRFNEEDKEWMRPGGGNARLGKFNPGQKLNTVFTGASLVVLMMTGIIMRWGTSLPLGWRTGATFVHDCFAIGLTVLVAGHIVMALTHPGAMRSIITGWVSEDWARRRASAWLAERRRAEDGAGSRSGDPEAG
jgi:formate dehydrogenase subunit gamma